MEDHMTTEGKRIRVMRIIARMNVGGPAVQVSGLMRHLDLECFDHLLLTGNCGVDEADYLMTQAPDLQAIRIEGLGRSIRALDDLRAFKQIRGHMRSFCPDVVHTHTAKAGVLGRLAALTVRPRPKLVHTFHGHLLNGYFGPLGTRLVIAIERSLARFTDALVAVGPEVRDDLLTARVGTPAKFHVVEPGLELREIPTRQEARARLRLPATGPVISVLGRITGIKRPDRMLDAIELAAPRIPGLHAILAGDGDLRAATEADAVRRHLPITFLGWRGDVETILAASDVTLLTSDNEGTPLSIIQAAMLGVPAVSTDVGSVRHIVQDGETGWVVPADAASLADALSQALLNTAERERRAATAKATAQQRYSVRRLASDYARIYTALAR